MALFGCDWDSYYKLKKENKKLKDIIDELKSENDWLFKCLEQSKDAVLELSIIEAFRNRPIGSNKIKIRTKEIENVEKIKKYCNQEKYGNEYIASISEKRLDKDRYGYIYSTRTHLKYEYTILLKDRIIAGKPDVIYFDEINNMPEHYGDCNYCKRCPDGMTVDPNTKLLCYPCNWEEKD